MKRNLYKSLCSALVASLLLISACKTPKAVAPVAASKEDEEMIFKELDEVEVSDVMPIPMDTLKEYQASATMTFDILHTALDLRFDYQKQHVIGKANISIKPYFAPISEVTLDADGFEIKEVKVNLTLAKYTYDGENLIIDLGKKYTRDEKFTILVDYIAKPNELEESDSEAITSDKGLFFIDPLENSEDLPTQIWTQGETEHNSRWYPTFDQPNERFTQEIKLTVPDKYLTLSNGTRTSSKSNNDGTRTDTWNLDKPHAPYLSMIAVGEWHEEKDTWNGKPLHYFVEKGWAKYAKKIYNHTPEMLTFFSEKLKYPYPWDKYAQIAVKEYVSGAMENTTAVIFGDFVQKTEREMIDNDNDQIVAHEMMHHWFGDLVTCEDWSNLTLNEGFANYAEYLWFEHKYGKERAEFHRFNEFNGYISSVENSGAHPLIHYYYKKDEDMFDAHSYNKGGMVLHMLRNYLGDDAFFAGLNRYLTTNAYTSVEVDELRMAFEDTTGEDLQWFFDQWFLGKGHPTVMASYAYDESSKELTIDIDQSSTDSTFYRPFILPLDVALYYTDGTMEYRPIRINKVKQAIKLANVKSQPEAFSLDGKNVTLGFFKENRTDEQARTLILRSDKIMDQIYSLGQIMKDENASLLDDGNIIMKLCGDKNVFSRILGVQLTFTKSTANKDILLKLEDMALRDPNSEVRNMALTRLAQIEDFDVQSLAALILQGEQAYPVISTALSLINDRGDKAKKYFQLYKNDPSESLAPIVASLITGESDEELAYLDAKVRTISSNHLYQFLEVYESYISGKSTSTIERIVDGLEKIVSGNGNIYRKMGAYQMISKAIGELNSKGSTDQNATDLASKISYRLEEIKRQETNPTIQSFLKDNN
jgi:aminopeptidase N